MGAAIYHIPSSGVISSLNSDVIYIDVRFKITSIPCKFKA